MARTSPARPVDVEALFPELVPLRRSATRLHPRGGNPGAHDSSLGGPVLWPRSQPWPCCRSSHSGTERSGAGSVPLVPVLQLFAADVTGLPLPDDADLLQVLWCPFHHAPFYAPRPEVFWRNSAQEDLEPAVNPKPLNAPRDHLPKPCVLHPERVMDYPSRDLPRHVADTLRPRIQQMEEATGWRYHHHLSVSPGVKVGGYPTWAQQPAWPDCPVCSRRMEHLLTINSVEFDGASWRSWLPLEDTPAEGTIWDRPFEERMRLQRAAGIMIGDSGGVYLFECRRCADRPLAYSSDS